MDTDDTQDNEGQQTLWRQMDVNLNPNTQQ